MSHFNNNGGMHQPTQRDPFTGQLKFALPNSVMQSSSSSMPSSITHTSPHSSIRVLEPDEEPGDVDMSTGEYEKKYRRY